MQIYLHSLQIGFMRRLFSDQSLYFNKQMSEREECVPKTKHKQENIPLNPPSDPRPTPPPPTMGSCLLLISH